MKEKFGGNLSTKLIRLNIKFDFFKKYLERTMNQYLREMSNVIIELKNVGHVLTDEQQVQQLYTISS